MSVPPRPKPFQQPLTALALSLVALLLTAPASGQASREIDPLPARALEPPFDLAEAGEGVGLPVVALRSDGGMVDVWRDAQGRVVGRWFGPADGETPPAGGDFVLTGPGTASGSVALARGADDRFLAVWQGPFPGVALSGRFFDGQGEALSEVFPLAESSAGSPAVGARGDRYVVAWWHVGAAAATLRYRRIGADGAAEPPVAVTEVPADGFGHTIRIGIAADATVTLSWNAVFRVEDVSGVWSRSFDGDDQAFGEVAEVATVSPSPGPLPHDLAVIGDGQGVRWMLALWREPLSPGRDAVRVRLLLRTRAVGEPTTVATPDASRPAPFTSRALGPVTLDFAGSFVVAAWDEAGGSPGLRARLLGADGSLVTAFAADSRFTIEEWRFDSRVVRWLDADMTRDGHIAFAWRLADTPASPTQPEPPALPIRTRRFRLTDRSCGSLTVTDLRIEPGAPTSDDPLLLKIRSSARCSVAALVDWSLEPSPTALPEVDGALRIDLRSEPLPGCASMLPAATTLPVQVSPLPAGEYQVTLALNTPEGACILPYSLTVASAAPPHPDTPPLVSARLPGFRTWVVISAAGESVVGVQEDACIPETLCVSGRVAGRSEVFVRVIGPRPNGRLWPTLVKFTTSRVEVWIEQISTGGVEYYVLEEARPGFDELPGRFDREGFEP